MREHSGAEGSLWVEGYSVGVEGSSVRVEGYSVGVEGSSGAVKGQDQRRLL